MTATISDCGQYRYTLTRPPLSAFPSKGTAAFCMLNPSTADATQDDPTIRRCRGFAERWDCNGIMVVNLYGLRSTDPRGLWAHADPVGPMNDYYLRSVANECGAIVCAWGANAKPERVQAAVAAIRSAGAELLCLGKTKDGHPRHPLYLRSDAKLIAWAPSP